MHVSGPMTGFLKKEINQMILPRWIDQVIAKVFEILHGAQVKKGSRNDLKWTSCCLSPINTLGSSTPAFRFGPGRI